MTVFIEKKCLVILCKVVVLSVVPISINLYKHFIIIILVYIYMNKLLYWTTALRIINKENK